MPIKHRIEITNPRDRDEFFMLGGMDHALAILRNAKSTLPGFGHALALVEAAEADMRAGWAGRAMRIASKDGHMIHECSAVITQVDKSGPFIEVQFPDLAEDPAS